MRKLVVLIFIRFRAVTYKGWGTNDPYSLSTKFESDVFHERFNDGANLMLHLLTGNVIPKGH